MEKQYNMLKWLKKIYIPFIILLIMIVVSVCEDNVSNTNIGNRQLGTKEYPYIIKNYDDLLNLAYEVNGGNSFKGCYFIQTEDIVMEGESWIPIGNSQTSFDGIYNGNGHTISNFNINSNGDGQAYALFGYIGGVIANLGIESGELNVQYGASIATNAVGNDALIINCYNKANISGVYVSGIAYNFENGTIASCVNLGNLDATGTAYAITFCSYNVKIYFCQGIAHAIAPDSISFKGSFTSYRDILLQIPNMNKRNIEVAIAQYLYAQRYNVKLLERNVIDGKLVFGNYDFIWYLVRFLNYYLLLYIICLYIIYFVKISILSNKCNKQTCINTVIISGIISFFLNTALIGKGISNISFGNIAFICAINALFCMAVAVGIKQRIFSIPKKISPYLVICMIFVGLIEISQFKLVPKYDGSLYYGSFVEGSRKFNFDLFTYIGSFTCWKWIQGLALFIAPFEFLFPGKIIGLHLGNVIISIITVYMFYNIIQELFKNKNPIFYTLSTLFLFLCPYELGLFSYLNMDTHLALFAVWLIYYKLKKNDVMISFVGFLISFTKITGMCLYVFYLAMCALIDILECEGRNIFQKFCKWYPSKKIVLWVTPVVLYMFFYIYGDRFIMLNFFGTYAADSVIKLKPDISTIDVLMQSFVYGFRWLIVIFGIVMLVYNKGKFKAMTSDAKKQYISVLVASIFVIIMLALYNSDANCPRYTAILNIAYSMLLPLIIAELFISKIQIFIESLFVGLMFMQLFITIDPMIIYTTDYIDLGNTKLYRLALKTDQRPGMSIGKGYALDDYTQCDIFCYNLQFTYADSLINSILADIKVDKDDKIYILDEYEYEFHISGSWNRNYKIYWDPENLVRTYNATGNIYINVNNLSTAQIEYLVETNNNNFNNKFYIIVPARVNPEKALSLLNEIGYGYTSTNRYSNFYGYLDLYIIEKQM